MKFKLIIKLVDCAPSKVKMSIVRESATEAIEHAAALYEANAMIQIIDVCNENGDTVCVYDLYKRF